MDSQRSDYENLIRPVEDQLMRSVWRIVQNPDDAEDAFQDAVVRIWKRMAQIRRHANPHALILRISINAALTIVRKRSRRARREEGTGRLDFQPDAGPDAAEALCEDERRREVARAIARLPEQQATAVTLRYLLEQPYRDVAETLGCAEPTARIHVSRGLARLSSLLAHLSPTQARRTQNEPRK